ncbi:MAG: SPASM domain-containing protein, partial [Pseudomonadota bacterium]
LPTREQVDRSVATVEAARETLKGRLVIDFVAPDYYALRPKRCMDGWGSQYFAVTPAGRMLPCHAAETITGLEFPHVRDHRLADIWRDAPLFNRFRGTDWMPEPCKSCAHRERDLGGCRCQAFAIAGDAGATDPACALSPHHDALLALVAEDAAATPAYVYRR